MRACVLFSSLIMSTLLFASVQQQSLEKCYAVKDSLQRLHCYEILTLQQRSSNAASTGSTRLDGTAPPSAVVIATGPQRVTGATKDSMDKLGSKYLQRSDSKQQKQDYIIKINSVAKDSRGRLIFYFANNQVWKQLEKSYVSYPKKQAFEAELSQGVMDDFRLRINNKGRMIRVKRVK